MKAGAAAPTSWDALRTALPERCRAVPLRALGLPARAYTYAAREGLVTLGDIAARSSAELLAARGMGRLSVRKTCEAVHAHLTATGVAIEARAPAYTRGFRGWDVVRASLPERSLAVPLRALGLPRRLCTYTEREGIVTLGDLAARSAAELLAARGMGAVSLQRTCEVVFVHLWAVGATLEGLPWPEVDAEVEAERAAARADAEARRRLVDTGLSESWRTLLLELSPVHRTVIERRAGLDGRAETLAEIGAAMGRSRERVRQIEQKALRALERQDVWLAGIRSRVAAALGEGEGAVPIEAIAADPWWSAIARAPDAIDYLGERLLGGEPRVVALWGRPHLSRCSQGEIDEAREELRGRAEETAVPAPLSTFRALVGPIQERLGRVPAEALFEELGELLRFEDVEGGEPRVIGVGTQVAVAFAILRASPSPMPIDELWSRASGAPGRRVPDGMLRFGHNTVGLLHHIPDAAGWTARLAPLAVRLMEEAGAERQWTTDELLEVLGEEVDLPAWLTGWHLTALLRTTGELRYLGRARFVLASGDRERIQYHDELCRILRDRGAPLARGELEAALVQKIGVKENTLSACLSRPQFLHCAPDLYGLRDRDLPGGAEALAEAAEHVATLLAERGRGFVAPELHAAVAALSAAHARWTPEMCLSALRGDARFRLSRRGGAGGSVGLSSWTSVRVPSRPERMRQWLQASGGRMRIETAVEWIAATTGRTLDRTALWNLAVAAGARLRGEWIEQKTEGS